MILIIGGGPAGLGAAVAIAKNGQEVTVLDSAPRAGGQYWRHRTEVDGYKSEKSDLYLREIDKNPLIHFISAATVWSASRVHEGFSVNYLVAGEELKITAKKLILATGAFDRSLPFAGWELPGVMTPGAAQSLLKGHGVLAGKRVIVAGTGPFLLPVATGIAAAGGTVLGLFEAQSPLRWALSPLALILNPSKFAELIHYVKELRKHRIKMQFGKALTSFDTQSAIVSSISSNLRVRAGSEEKIDCDVVAVGWGFTPDVTLGGILGCEQKVDRDGTVIFKIDKNQKSSQKDIWIAGEATGIGGSDLALVEGEIAALDCIGADIPRYLALRKIRKTLFARALQRSYPVADGWKQWSLDTTKICRCEEVSLKDISDSVTDLGAFDSRTAKLFTRAGMGLCQGRVCSRNVSEIVAGLQGCPVSDNERIGYSNRPIATPISLGQLSDGKSSE